MKLRKWGILSANPAYHGHGENLAAVRTILRSIQEFGHGVIEYEVKKNETTGDTEMQLTVRIQKE